MKTIRQLQLKDELSFLYNYILMDYLRVLWVYLVVYLLAYIFL